MSFTNITDEELVGKGVTGLPDTPGLTTEEMQAQFDEYPVFLKDKFKGLIAELEATTAALSIGAAVPENITADGNIQSILEGLRNYVDATVVALGTGDMARGIYDPDRDGIIAPAQGGTGLTSLQAVRNAMGLGDTTGALPIANGGTGQTTAAGIRNALGLGNTTGALPLANGGTGASTAIEALKNLGLYQYFVSNNNIEPTTTAANHHNVGDFIVYDSSKKFAKVTAEINIGDTITHGTNVINEPIGAELTNMKATFQNGVDTIYDAIDDYVTPAASTPSALAAAVDDVYNKGKTDAESVTWTDSIYIDARAYFSGTGDWIVNELDASASISLVTVKKLKNRCGVSVTIGFLNNASLISTVTLANNQEVSVPSNANNFSYSFSDRQEARTISRLIYFEFTHQAKLN